MDAEKYCETILRSSTSLRAAYERKTQIADFKNALAIGDKNAELARRFQDTESLASIGAVLGFIMTVVIIVVTLGLYSTSDNSLGFKKPENVELVTVILCLSPSVFLWISCFIKSRSSKKEHDTLMSGTESLDEFAQFITALLELGQFGKEILESKDEKWSNQEVAALLKRYAEKILELEASHAPTTMCEEAREKFHMRYDLLDCLGLVGEKKKAFFESAVRV
jgi:hypothetical protein